MSQHTPYSRFMLIVNDHSRAAGISGRKAE